VHPGRTSLRDLVQEPTPVGHWSNGPIADAWKDGVLWFLPNHHVQ
jgi:hypothetical protein